MIHERLDTAIEYVAKKHGLSKRKVELVFLSQFKFMKHVMDQVDMEKNYFPTLFYSEFLTLGFSEKKWEKMREHIIKKEKKSEAIRHSKKQSSD